MHNNSKVVALREKSRGKQVEFNPTCSLRKKAQTNQNSEIYSRDQNSEKQVEIEIRISGKPS